MIQKIRLLHHLQQQTYEAICEKYAAGTQRNRVSFGDDILSFFLYNIQYDAFGHIWFMDCIIDFPAFGASCKAFEEMLYASYHRWFGDDIMAAFPSYEQLVCTYIEYSAFLPFADAEAVLLRLAEKCPPEQLHRELWAKYKKPHGTIEFCMAQVPGGIETLARCHGTALKKRMSDPSVLRDAGCVPTAIIDEKTEETIMNWLYGRYKLI